MRYSRHFLSVNLHKKVIQFVDCNSDYDLLFIEKKISRYNFFHVANNASSEPFFDSSLVENKLENLC